MNSLEDSNTEPEFEAALEIIGASGMRELAIIMREAPFGIYVDHPSRQQHFHPPIFSACAWM